MLSLIVQTHTSRRGFLHSIGASLAAWPLLGATSVREPPQALEYAAFKDPPGTYRGTAMWGYSLSKVTDDEIVSGVQNLARQRYGGFLINNGGGNDSNLDPAYVQQANPFFHF